MPDKRVIWQGSPSQVTNLFFYIFCIVIPFLIPFAIWRYLSTKKTKYILTPTRLKTEVGVLNIRRDNLELLRVRDYAIEEPLFLRLFGLGNIYLETTDRSHPDVAIRAIKKPQWVAEQIYAGSQGYHMHEIEIIE